MTGLCMLQELSDQTGAEFNNADVRWVITVPAIWKQPAKQFMREAAYKVRGSEGKTSQNISKQDIPAHPLSFPSSNQSCFSALLEGATF